MGNFNFFSEKTGPFKVCGQKRPISARTSMNSKMRELKGLIHTNLNCHTAYQHRCTLNSLDLFTNMLKFVGYWCVYVTINIFHFFLKFMPSPILNDLYKI